MLFAAKLEAGQGKTRHDKAVPPPLPPTPQSSMHKKNHDFGEYDLSEAI